MLEPGVQSYNCRGTLERSKPGRELGAKETVRESGLIPLGQTPTLRGNLCSEAELPAEAVCLEPGRG